MKSIHYYVYGLLTGSVLILSTILMVKSFNEAEAQSTASRSQEVAMVTGQYQNSEHMLYVIMQNPGNGQPVLLTYSVTNYQLGLVAARNMKFDRRVIDQTFGRPQPGQNGKTYPSFGTMKQSFEQGQTNRGGGAGRRNR